MEPSLPLFPLTTALVPGLVLPLHIFEPRYRLMVEELLDKPEDDREFGIVGVRDRRAPASGPQDLESISRENNGAHGNYDDLYPVGVTAVLRQAERRDDGRYDIVTIGSRRFHLDDVDRSAPLLRARVTYLPEPDVDVSDPRVQTLVASAVTAFENYRGVLGGRLDEDRSDDEHVPDDPSVLSYLITAALVIDGATRQELLASPDAVTRLRAGIRILRSESMLISTLGAVPALDLLNATPSEN